MVSTFLPNNLKAALKAITLLIIGCVAFMPGLSQAQTKRRADQGFRGIVNIGLNAAQIDGDGLSGFFKPGLYVGFAPVFDINEAWSVGPEFLFSQKGARTTPEQEEFSISQNYRINYVQFPILAHYRGLGKFQFHGGPVFNTLINARTQLGGGNSVNTTDRYRRLDVGVLGGFEYALLDRLSFAARWYYSMLPIGKDRLDNSLVDLYWIGAGLRNNVVSVSVRWTISDYKDTRAKRQ